MTKLYECFDRDDNLKSFVLVNERGCAWMNVTCIETVKANERLYSYDDSDSFVLRAINPVLVAEW